MHPCSKHWHLIDFIIVRCSDIKGVLITRAMRGAECWTDQRMIVAKRHMKVSPPLQLQKPNKKRLHSNPSPTKTGIKSKIKNQTQAAAAEAGS